MTVFGTYGRPLGWIVLGIVISALLAYLISSRVAHEALHIHGSPSEDYHAWLHRNLRLSPEQERALAPIEKAFEDSRNSLKELIEQDARDLAHGFREGRTAESDWEPVLKRIQKNQAELQRLTLVHFFEMEQHLDEDEAERLWQWTHNSIVHEH